MAGPGLLFPYAHHGMLQDILSSEIVPYYFRANIVGVLDLVVMVNEKNGKSWRMAAGAYLPYRVIGIRDNASEETCLLASDCHLSARNHSETFGWQDL